MNVSGVAKSVRAAVAVAVAGVTGPRRRAVRHDGVAHIDVKGVGHFAREELRKDLRRAVKRMEGVDWVEVNAITGQLVVAFASDVVSLDTLVDVIESVEQAHGVSNDAFESFGARLPEDGEAIRRSVIALAADLAGIPLAVTGRVLRVLPFPPQVAAVVSVVGGHPRFRGPLEHHLGTAVTDAAISLTSAVSQALGQGVAGLAVDGASRAAMLGEQLAVRGAYRRRRSDLVGHGDVAPVPVASRPVPLPHGPAERWADVAGGGAIVGFAAAAVAFGDVRRAADAAVAAVPKAAWIGREAFAEGLACVLAARDIVVMAPSALRVLDRVDTVVVDAELLLRKVNAVDVVVPVDGGATDALAAVIAGMLDPDNPSRLISRGEQLLAPVEALPTAVMWPPGARVQGRQLEADGAALLGFVEGGRLVAFARLAWETQPYAMAVVTSARQAGHRLVVVGGPADAEAVLGDVERLPTKELTTGIRAMQAAGAVVVYISAQHRAALRAADVGVGVVTSSHGPPWGADIVTGPSLADAWLVLEATRPAREVTRRSVIVAAAGTGVGVLWAVLGPARGSAERASLGVNGAAAVALAAGQLSSRSLGGRRPPLEPSPHRWHALAADDVLALVDSSAAGLSRTEQARRRAESPSDHRPASPSFLRATWHELDNPLTPVLAVGTALSAAVGSITDAAMVGTVMAANALIGGAQRVLTDRSIAVLATAGATAVRVRHDGVVSEDAAIDVVVGDVLELSAGDVVPADARLLHAVGLEADESAITGESLPVAKYPAPINDVQIPERTSMLFAGTTISGGTGSAVIVATGASTEMGRVLADLGSPPASGVERRLARIARVTVPATLTAGVAAGALGLVHRRPVAEAVQAGVSLAVAAVPEGLPLLASAAQLAAAHRLAGRNALVRNPRAIEALGRIERLAFDKTGTLTQGRLTVRVVADGVAVHHANRLETSTAAVLAGALRATPAVNDGAPLPHATDRAVVDGAASAGIDIDDGRWSPLGALPFDPSRSYHAVVGQLEGGPELVVKGAPETVLPRCATWRSPTGSVVVDDELIVRLHDEVERLARQGLRILAVARRAAPDLIERLTTANRTSSGPDPGLDDGGQLDDADIDHLELLGFLGLADPVRSSAAWAVAAVRRAGIEVTMITGDHPSTAEAIADELDILNGRRVVTGAELAELDDEDLDSILLDIAVFARITPDQKVRIVNAYQRLDMAIAMTGDGGNDAPAIRLADAGIALGRHAAAAAREAADVVVLDDRIETIVDAIIEGRAMWTSVRAALAILLGGNVGEVGFTLMGTLVSGEAPLNPRQLLLVNLLTDLVPALVLAVRSPDASSPEKLLGEGPERSLGGPLTREITVRAVSTASGATSAWWLARLTGTRTRARTVGLVGLVSAQLGQTVVAGGFSPTVIGSSAVSLAALAGIVQTPGLSQFFGSRPIGPVGWTIGLGAGVTATAGSVALGPLIEHLWLQLGRAPLDASAPERPRSSSITIS